MTCTYRIELEAATKHFSSASKAGIGTNDAQVLLAFMAGLDAETGELTSDMSVADVSKITTLSYDQVQRSLKKLRTLGMITRRQVIKRAGETAFTTILPCAFEAVGLKTPYGTSMPKNGHLPQELADLMCTQSWLVVDAVTTAWSEHQPLSAEAISDLRGGPIVLERITRMLNQRYEASMQDLEIAVAQVELAEEQRKAGLDTIHTADGDMVVDVAAFERLCPVAVDWQFVKDVITTMHARNPLSITKANIRNRIAEAAYARIALPFVKDKAWSDGVRLLARQMETKWSKPTNIWPSWYTAADAVIHRAAVSA